MRITLELEPDVLQQVRQIAQADGTSVGKTVSRLLREHFPPALVLDQAAQVLTPDEHGFTYRNGFAVLPSRGAIITMEHIRKIMDDEGI